MTTLIEIAARLQAAETIEAILLVFAKATVILGIARLLLMVMPRASAATRHVVATAALVAVAAMPVMTLIIPAWHVVSEKPAGTTTPSATMPGGSEAPARTIGASDAEDDRGPSTLGTAISVARATGIVPDEPLTAMTRALNVTGATWKGTIALTLLAGSALMLLHMLLGIAGVWHVAKNATPLTSDAILTQLGEAREALALQRDVRLLVSSRISVPVLWGIFKPVLLLPADAAAWPADRIRVVLMHELAHLVRYDGVSLIVTRIATAFFWYHPLAWSLERAGRNECERACDDLVLAGGARPSEYADHLLAIARSMPAFDPFRSVTLAMSRKSQLEGRLLSILQPHVVRRVFSGRSVAIACALAVAVIIPVSAMRLTAGPPKETVVASAEIQTAQATQAGATVNVTDEVGAIADFFVAKLGRYDKRADRLLREPKNGEDWYDRAWDLYRNDRYAEAAEAFHRAAGAGHSPARSLYNAACSWALLGDAPKATASLRGAMNAGWDDFDHITRDSDFDPIRSDPAFVQLVAAGGSDVATRRMNESMAKYEALREGRTVTREHSEGVREGVREGIRDAIHEALGKERGKQKELSWFGVGFDLLRLRQLDQSIDAFQNAIRQGEKPATSMYNIACAYALKGDATNGLAWLDKAIDYGFSSHDKLKHDPDIALLRRQETFNALAQKASDLEMRGCCDNWWKDEPRDGWRKAATHHRQIAQRYPGSGRAWFNLGYTALQARDFPTALDAFNRTIALNYRTGTASYNIACVHALQGNRDAAFEWLEKARAGELDLRSHLNGDDDLDSLHSDPRWDALRAKAGADRIRWTRK